MNKFKVGKEYKTVNGSTARIYAVACGGDKPIHGAVYNPRKEAWVLREWTKLGKNPLGWFNLVPPKITRSTWLVLSPHGTLFLTQKPHTYSDCIAVKHVTVHEGEFDE